MIDLRNSRAFTIIELLVVVVVIGILAAVSIVAYNGVQQSARDRAVMSDVEAVDTQIARYSVKNGGKFGSAVRWYSAAASNVNIPFIPTEGNVVDVVASDDEYCIRVYNPRGGEYKTLATAAKKSYPASACDSLSPSLPALADSPNPPNSGVVTLVAGSTYGSVDGDGSTAKFQGIIAMTGDSSGNLYVSDSGKIRKVAPNGTVSTFVMASASGITRNASGELFVASGNAIRKIASNGTISLFVGGTNGAADGTGAGAQFQGATVMTIDASGNLYVVDSSHKIRKVTPEGVVTTFAGSITSGYQDATGTAARFNAISGITAAPNGDIYVADKLNDRIRKITAAGVVTTFAGNGQSGSNVDGNGTSAGVSSPRGIVIDGQGTIYATNAGRMRKITPAGVVTTLTSSNGVNSFDGNGTAVLFNNDGYLSLVVDSTGSLFVGQGYYDESRILKIQ